MTAHPAQNQQGLSLLEVLVAIAFVTISITAMVTISNAALGNVNRSRDQGAADQYARQAIEITRAYRDRQAPFSNFNSRGVQGNPDLYSINTAAAELTPRQELTAAQKGQFDSNPCTATYVNQATYNVDASGKFRYGVLIEYLSANSAKITSVVCYTDKGVIRQVKVQTILANIQ